MRHVFKNWIYEDATDKGKPVQKTQKNSNTTLHKSGSKPRVLLATSKGYIRSYCIQYFDFLYRSKAISMRIMMKNWMQVKFMYVL